MYFFSTKVTCPCFRWASALMTWSRSESAASAPGAPIISNSAQASSDSATTVRPAGHHASVTFITTPEVKEVEPIVGIAANVFLQNLRVALDRRPHRGVPLPRLDVREVRERFEHDMVAVPAPIQADHEDHGPPHDSRRPHRPIGKARRPAQEPDLL